MRMGVLLPTFEIPADPLAIGDFAQAAEQLGYTHLMEWEHVISADQAHRPDWGESVNTLQNFYEPFVLFGYLAGLTRRIQFATPRRSADDVPVLSASARKASARSAPHTTVRPAG